MIIKGKIILKIEINLVISSHLYIYIYNKKYNKIIAIYANKSLLKKVTFSIILERNKWIPRIFVLKNVKRFKNIYVRVTDDGRRKGTFRRTSNRWWMRTLSQSSLHRKWSGSLFTNADKTIHFIVFYLCSSRKRIKST